MPWLMLKALKKLMFDPDEALEVARKSVHAFGTDESSPYCDPCSDIVSDDEFIRLRNVKESEIDELIKNNPY
jgi:hypothetical protein